MYNLNPPLHDEPYYVTAQIFRLFAYINSSFFHDTVPLKTYQYQAYYLVVENDVQSFECFEMITF